MEKHIEATELSIQDLDNVAGGVTGVTVSAQQLAVGYKLPEYKVSEYKLPDYKLGWK